MEHIMHLYQDHSTFVYVVLILMILAGLGVGLSAKMVVPLLKSFFSRDRVEIVANPTRPDHDQAVHQDDVRHPCDCSLGCLFHPDLKKCVDGIKFQQGKNMDMITAIRLQQEANQAAISEMERRQTEMWEQLVLIPKEFGEIKGQLGEIKGMIRILHRHRDVEP